MWLIRLQGSNTDVRDRITLGKVAEQTGPVALLINGAGFGDRAPWLTSGFRGAVILFRTEPGLDASQRLHTVRTR